MYGDTNKKLILSGFNYIALLYLVGNHDIYSAHKK